MLHKTFEISDKRKGKFEKKKQNKSCSAVYYQIIHFILESGLFKGGMCGRKTEAALMVLTLGQKGDPPQTTRGVGMVYQVATGQTCILALNHSELYEPTVRF